MNLEDIKQSGCESNLKHCALGEDDMLLYDPLIPIMAMGFSGQAFLNVFAALKTSISLLFPQVVIVFVSTGIKSVVNAQSFAM